MRNRLENIEGRLALGKEITPPNVDWLVGKIHRQAKRIEELQDENMNLQAQITLVQCHVDLAAHFLNRAPWVSR